MYRQTPLARRAPLANTPARAYLKVNKVTFKHTIVTNISTNINIIVL